MKNTNKIFPILISLVVIAVLFSIAYAVTVQRTNAQKKMYLEVIGLNEKEYSVTSMDTQNQFSVIGVNDGFVGAAYFLKQNDSGYEIIAGPLQEPPMCSLMDEWGVPKELYVDCYTDEQVAH